MAVETDTPAPPSRGALSRERGYAASGGWWDNALLETAPELTWPNCLAVFDNMRRQDAQVGSVLRAVTSPIQRTAWRIDGEGCDPEVTRHVADDLGLPIVGQGNLVPRTGRSRDRFSWTGHLRLALLMLPFGHSYFEQVYRWNEVDQRWHLRKLGPRLPRTIMKVNVARDGGLESIEQRPTFPTGGQKLEIPVGQLVAYVLDREGGNWFGQSLLRPAYKNWLIKDQLLRVQAQTIDRNGMGIPVYTGAQNEKDLKDGEDVATSVRAGDNSGTAIPYGSKLDLMGVTGQLPDADVPIRYHDEQIARAVLAHFLNLGTQTGSWALGSTFADFFTLSLQAIADEVKETANHHVIEDLVDVAFSPNEAAPRLVYDEIGSRGDSIVNAIAVLVNAQVLKADEDLEQFVRTALRLPARDKTTPLEVP